MSWEYLRNIDISEKDHNYSKIYKKIQRIVFNNLNYICSFLYVLSFYIPFFLYIYI